MTHVYRTPAAEDDSPQFTLGRAVSSKAEQAVRLAMARYAGRAIRLHLVTEYPKSGGTWLAQMIAAYLGVPFPRNRLPNLGECVLHGHYRPARGFRHLRRILWLTRDGRDVMVSLYHHYFVWNERTRRFPKESLYYRRTLGFADPDDVPHNLPSFIATVFSHVPARLAHFTHPGNWSTFNLAWLEQDRVPSRRLARLRYEDLLADTPRTLERALLASGAREIDRDRLRGVVDRYRFDRQANRAPGHEDKTSFLRKGVAGDWRNYFTLEAAEMFERHAGTALIALGYESDRGWVDRVR